MTLRTFGAVDEIVIAIALIHPVAGQGFSVRDRVWCVCVTDSVKWGKGDTDIREGRQRILELGNYLVHFLVVHSLLILAKNIRYSQTPT